MSRNGSGVYNLPSGNPVVSGTTITTTWANNTLTDIATALTGSLAADGQTTATGNLKMGSNRITGLADGTLSTDAATKSQVDAVTAGLGTMSTQNANAVAVTGGAVDGTTVGTTTRSSVKATTLDLGLATQSVAIGQGNASIMKNRIINGAMVIDQRNAGAAVTTSGAYPLDRFYVSSGVGTSTFSSQQSSTAPAGFTKSLYYTVTAADATLDAADRAYIVQSIEGYNTADLGWGTANAKTVTLSFWVRSSLTGTFGGSLRNEDANRSYPFTYTISAANTWTQASVTIAGDTSGTWVTTNGIGIQLVFGLGLGSNWTTTAGAWAAGNYLGPTGGVSLTQTTNANLYITGVQLEVGSSATGFEYRQYTTELALCQRYYWKIYGSQDTGGSSVYSGIGTGYSSSTSVVSVIISLQTQMRVNPTISYGGNIYVQDGGGASVTSISANYGGRQSSFMAFNTSGANTLGRGLVVYTGSATTDFISGSAEL